MTSLFNLRFFITRVFVVEMLVIESCRNKHFARYGDPTAPPQRQKIPIILLDFALLALIKHYMRQQTGTITYPKLFLAKVNQKIDYKGVSYLLGQGELKNYV